MSCTAWGRSVWAAGMMVVLALPYAKPFACGAADAAPVSEHTHHSMSVPAGAALQAIADQPVCHDSGLCAAVHVGPVFDAGVPSLVAAAVVATSPKSPGTLVDRPTTPKTPPPRV